MINFIKTLSYETRPQNTDVFSYLRAVGLQKIDPPSSSPRIIATDATLIFHSPARRVTDTIQKRHGVRYVSTELLREIPFDLASLASREEWVAHGSSIVRARFVEAFVKDTLPTPRSMLFSQTRLLLHNCSKETAETSIAVISHSFRLKLLEAFIHTAGTIATEPTLLGSFIHPDKKTYPFGYGFTATIEELKRALQ